MKRIDPQKLLQPTSNTKQANFSAKFLVPAAKVESKPSAKVEETSTPEQQELKQKTSSIKLKFIEVTKLFSNKSKLEKNKNRAKRIEAERERRKRREEEKENSKTTFKFGSILPKLSLPRTGFLDTIKRFLLYSLLGFAVDAFAPLIPKLLELGKTIVPAIRFLTGFVGALAEKVVDYIDTGYKVFDTLKGYINSIIPANLSNTFNRFSGALNLALNGALIAATAAVSVLPSLMGSGDIDIDPKTGRPKRRGAGKVRKGLGNLGLLGVASLFNPKVRKFLVKQLTTRKQRTAFQQGRARAALGTRRRIEREQKKRAAAQTRKNENLAADLKRDVFIPQQKRTGFAPGLGGAIDLSPKERKRIKSIQITGRDGSVEKYRLNSRGKVIDFKKIDKKNFVKITGDVDPAAQRRFVSPNTTAGGLYKNFNISDVKTTRTGKQFIEVALPGTTKRRVSPRTGRALQYLMAQNNPIDEMTAREIFNNPQDFTELVTEVERRQREIKIPSPKKKMDKGSVSQQRTPKGVKEAAKTGSMSLKAAGITKTFGKRFLGPAISTLFDIAVAVATGEDIDMAVVTSAGAGIGSFVGAFLGSFFPGAGNVIGGVVGSAVGSVAADYLYETFVKKKTDLKADEAYKKMFEKSLFLLGDPGFTDPGLKPDTPGYHKRYIKPQAPLPLPPGPKQYYSIEDLVRLALSVGFKKDNAAIAAAIAMAESEPPGNPNSHNTKYPDNSYGLWQINMLDEPGYMLGEERRKRFNIKDNTELFDPTLNAQIAYKLSGGSNFSAWTTYTGGAYKAYYDAAKEALQRLSKTPTTFKKKASIDKSKTTKIAQGLDDQADYEGDGTLVVLMPITKTITQPVPVSNDGGSVVVNSNTGSPLTFTQTLVG